MMKFCYLKASLITFVAMLLIYEIAGSSVRIFMQYTFSNIDSSTNGVITVSEMDSIPRSIYYHNIKYSYRVNEKNYESSIINYENKVEDAAKVVKRYKVGQSIVVHYDSSWPFLAVLEKGNLGRSIYMDFLIAFLVSLIPLFWQVLGSRKWVKNTDQHKRIRKW